MKHYDTIASWTGTGFTVAIAAINAEVRDIISWALTILVGLVTLGFTIYSWYKKAKADGKITKEEVEEGVHEVTEVIDDIKEKTKNDKTK